MKDSQFFYRYYDHLFLYITGDCNMRCSYCYLGSNIQGEMSIANVRRVATFFHNSGTRYVTILGGEPTLHPDFVSIIEVFHSMDYRVIVDTNGLFDRSLLDAVDPSHVYRLLFSLDRSYSGTGYGLRVLNSEPQVMESIDHAAQCGFSIGVISCLSRSNADEATRMMEYASGSGIKLVNFHRLMPQGRGRTLADTILSPLEWIEVCSHIESGAREFDGVVLYPPVFIQHDKASDYSKMGYRGCTARSADRIAILPDLTIRLCTLFLDSKEHYARFDSKGLQLNTREDSELFVEYAQNEVCVHCERKEKREMCCGGCNKYLEIVKELGMSEQCSDDYIMICPLWKVRAGSS